MNVKKLTKKLLIKYMIKSFKLSLPLPIIYFLIISLFKLFSALSIFAGFVLSGLLFFTILFNMIDYGEFEDFNLKDSYNYP